MEARENKIRKGGRERPVSFDASSNSQAVVLEDPERRTPASLLDPCRE